MARLHQAQAHEPTDCDLEANVDLDVPQHHNWEEGAGQVREYCICWPQSQSHTYETMRSEPYQLEPIPRCRIRSVASSFPPIRPRTNVSADIG